jgi:hypothetical protein
MSSLKNIQCKARPEVPVIMITAYGDDDTTKKALEGCRTDFRETGDNPVKGFVYRGSMTISRSVPWLIAIHGFNTRGPWQEEFSWRIATRFKYHAPVLIYKYGLVRFGVLFRSRHGVLARQLSQRIRKAVAYASSNCWSNALTCSPTASISGCASKG